MSERLKAHLISMQKDQAGELWGELRKEYLYLCKTKYNYRPDMSCSNCVFKWINRLLNDFR